MKYFIGFDFSSKQTHETCDSSEKNNLGLTYTKEGQV